MKRNKLIKYFIIICCLLLFNNFGLAKNAVLINQEAYKKLCGIWTRNKKFNSESLFSWGNSKILINGSLEIDLGHETPYLQSASWGSFEIIKAFKENDFFAIVIRFFDKKEYELKISLIDNDTILFHETEFVKMDPFLNNPHYKKNLFYKISGPIIKYYRPKTSNLRLRSEPSLKGNVIRLLNKDEKLLLIKKEQEETIDGVKGTWIKVLSEKDEMGWCFDGFLEAL